MNQAPDRDLREPIAPARRDLAAPATNELPPASASPHSAPSSVTDATTDLLPHEVRSINR